MINIEDALMDFHRSPVRHKTPRTVVSGFKTRQTTAELQRLLHAAAASRRGNRARADSDIRVHNISSVVRWTMTIIDFSVALSVGSFVYYHFSRFFLQLGFDELFFR